MYMLYRYILPASYRYSGMVDGKPYPAGFYTASADTSLPDGDTAPVEETRPLDGNSTVSGNDTAPSDGDTTPSDGDTTPSDGDTTPSDGDTTPPDGDTAPSDGDTTPSDDVDLMQSILEDFRAELAEKDTDVGDLADSLRTFVDHMIEAEGAEAERLAQEMALDEAVPLVFPISGHDTWAYPIEVEYYVHILGVEDYIPQTEVYDDPETFETDYAELAAQCRPGSNFKDFYIRYVHDAEGVVVYDAEAGTEEPPPEEPVEDLSPAILEALQSMDSRLEGMGTDISTISANTIDYHAEMLAVQKDSLQLQSINLATNMAIGFSVFLFLGYTIAHGFWQRMKVG